MTAPIKLVAAGACWDGAASTDPIANLHRALGWDGAASTDPIANLHRALEQSYAPVTTILVSDWECAWILIEAFARGDEDSYRVRNTARSLFFHETRRWKAGRRGGSFDYLDVIARARALEPR